MDARAAGSSAPPAWVLKLQQIGSKASLAGANRLNVTTQHDFHLCEANKYEPMYFYMYHTRM